MLIMDVIAQQRLREVGRVWFASILRNENVVRFIHLSAV